MKRQSGKGLQKEKSHKKTDRRTDENHRKTQEERDGGRGRQHKHTYRHDVHKKASPARVSLFTAIAPHPVCWGNDLRIFFSPRLPDSPILHHDGTDRGGLDSVLTQTCLQTISQFLSRIIAIPHITDDSTLCLSFILNPLSAGPGLFTALRSVPLQSRV